MNNVKPPKGLDFTRSALRQLTSENISADSTLDTINAGFLYAGKTPEGRAPHPSGLAFTRCALRPCLVLPCSAEAAAAMSNVKPPKGLDFARTALRSGPRMPR
jgi:hypothetical protein